MDSDSKSLSFNYHERPLLFPDEVGRFDNEKFIMVQRSRNPVQMYKVQYKYWIEDQRICEEYPVHTLPAFRDTEKHSEKPLNTIDSLEKFEEDIKNGVAETEQDKDAATSEIDIEINWDELLQGKKEKISS